MKRVFGFALLLLISSTATAAMRRIPLEITPTGHLATTAVINGVEAKFVVDTGATGSVIDVHQLATFGVDKPDSSIDGVAVGDEESGIIPTYLIAIDSYEIAGFPLALTQIFSNDNSMLGEGYAGLIGRDALIELHALLDLATPQLLIPEQESDVQTFFAQDANQAFSVEPLIPTSMGFSLLHATINEKPVNLLVDTGSGYIVLDGDTARKALDLSLKNHPMAKTLNNAGEEVPMQMASGAKLKVGIAETGEDLLVTDLDALKAAVEQNYDGTFAGILGNSLLTRYSAIIDVKDSKLYLR